MSFNVRVIGAEESATTDGAQTGLMASTEKAKLFTVTAYNATGGMLYLQAHDANRIPADGAKPKLVTPVFANLSGGFNFGDGTIFGTGIYLCWSTTDVTKTCTWAQSGIIDATFRKQR